MRKRKLTSSTEELPYDSDDCVITPSPLPCLLEKVEKVMAREGYGLSFLSSSPSWTRSNHSSSFSTSSLSFIATFICFSPFSLNRCLCFKVLLPFRMVKDVRYLNSSCIKKKNQVHLFSLSSYTSLCVPSFTERWTT